MPFIVCDDSDHCRRNGGGGDGDGDGGYDGGGIFFISSNATNTQTHSLASPTILMKQTHNSTQKENNYKILACNV